MQSASREIIRAANSVLRSALDSVGRTDVAVVATQGTPMPVVVTGQIQEVESRPHKLKVISDVQLTINIFADTLTDADEISAVCIEALSGPTTITVENFKVLDQRLELSFNSFTNNTTGDFFQYTQVYNFRLH